MLFVIGQFICANALHCEYVLCNNECIQTEENMTTRKLQEKELIAILSSNLNKKSKWYAEDLASVVKAVASKSTKELKAALCRWRAINETTQCEINLNLNCNLRGLK
jgi:hypothetical protein